MNSSSDRKNVREHMAFARGVHSCPGGAAGPRRGPGVDRAHPGSDARHRDRRNQHGPADERRYNYEPTYILRGSAKCTSRSRPRTRSAPWANRFAGKALIGSVDWSGYVSARIEADDAVVGKTDQAARLAPARLVLDSLWQHAPSSLIPAMGGDRNERGWYLRGEPQNISRPGSEADET